MRTLWPWGMIVGPAAVVRFQIWREDRRFRKGPWLSADKRRWRA